MKVRVGVGGRVGVGVSVEETFWLKAIAQNANWKLVEVLLEMSFLVQSLARFWFALNYLSSEADCERQWVEDSDSSDSSGHW